MTWVASPKGRAQRRFTYGQAFDAESDRRLAGREHLAVVRPELCHLHPLEVKAIADGDAAQGIKGLDPILTGQLTREEIKPAD
jgi:hypothetical protein